jgi:hypothetical protein
MWRALDAMGEPLVRDTLADRERVEWKTPTPAGIAAAVLKSLMFDPADHYHKLRHRPLAAVYGFRLQAKGIQTAAGREAYLANFAKKYEVIG